MIEASCHFLLYQDMFAKTCQAVEATRLSGWGSAPVKGLRMKTLFTQLFLDYLSDKDPSSVKFFDETGFQLPDSGHRVYGYSPVGEQCFDVRRYLSTANITLNFLAGVDGLKYANIVQGASNSIAFLRFFSEASQTVDPNTLRPVLEVGDIVVVYNFAAHHGDAEVDLRSF